MKRLFCILILVAAGCSGYQHVFKTPPGFEDVNTIAIDLFKNKTLYTNISEQFAVELEREINSKTALRIADHGEADAVITGSVDSYDRIDLREFQNGNVSRYGIMITVSYRVTRLPSQGQPERVIASAERVHYTSEYEVNSNWTESDARAEATRRVAREVVSNIFETWEGKK